MNRRRGGISVQLLVLMVPVFFGLMGFAIDLGRLYMARGELQTAAESMALAAASNLIGTDVSTGNATAAARRMVETGTGYGNKYDYGIQPVGESTGSLNSEIVEPTFYDTVSAATGDGETTGGEAGGTTARHVRIDLTGDVPLTFWRFLSLGQEGKVSVRVRSVAGMSAPVCTACGMDPIAVAPVDAGDTTNFGFIVGTRYTFGYVCSGPPIPQPLPNSDGGRVQYVILNRSNENASVFADDQQQLFRTAAQGLVPSTTDALSCMSIGTDESIWASAGQLACNTNTVQTGVRAFLCGLSTRMDTSLVQGCDSIAEVDSLWPLYSSDTDVEDISDYAAYVGNGRRVLTVAIVDTINPTGTMNVQAFRQFLIEPVQNTAGIAPTDPNGRFQVMYLGAVMPVKQGRFDGGCTATGGPGKVVLHR